MKQSENVRFHHCFHFISVTQSKVLAHAIAFQFSIVKYTLNSLSIMEGLIAWMVVLPMLPYHQRPTVILSHINCNMSLYGNIQMDQANHPNEQMEPKRLIFHYVFSTCKEKSRKRHKREFLDNQLFDHLWRLICGNFYGK